MNFLLEILFVVSSVAYADLPLRHIAPTKNSLVPADPLYNCDGLKEEACYWKLTCQKDPSHPNKVIPADCSQNYKEPEPPAQAAAPPPPKVEAKKEKTPLEQLYYIDDDDLRDQFLLPEDARKKQDDDYAKDDYPDAPTKDKSKEKSVKDDKDEKVKDKAPASARQPVKIDLPENWEEIQ